jgi:WD40 repeat protein
VSGNPFLGPQPYRAGDRDRFFGREEVTRQLANGIRAHPCVTLFGPSGAGKSSLMQAGVIPLLERTQDSRVVHIEGWLKEEAPLERLVQALFHQLGLGRPPEDLSPARGLERVLELAEQQSDRPLLIYLDQLEQLLQQGRDAAGTEALLQALQELARRPMRGLQLVLALREDYLGRFRERARGRRELLEQGFRLGPLTVGEMVQVACQIAQAGAPPQEWPREAVSELMRQVRVAGQEPTPEAEVQAAFAQIVCRTLWEERAKGGIGQVEAEPMLHQYLETTLEGLGPLKVHARRLLEEHLVASDGSRTLLLEPQARAVLSELSEAEASTVLARLESAAVLRAEEHQGSRYFELGHDWLASKVLEQREDREKKEREEQERREQERRLKQERAARRKLALLAGGAVVVAVLMGLVMLWALSQQREAEAARAEAEKAGFRARDHALMAGAREQLGRNRSELTTRLLLEVRRPEQVHGWEQLALDVLMKSVPRATLRCHGQALAASFSPDGTRVAVGCADGTAWVWSADGKGEPLVLRGHESPVLSASFSPDGLRVVTASWDKTARVWSADGKGEPLVLRGHEDTVRSTRFSPDGLRVVTASDDKTARVWSADGKGEPLVLRGHEGPIWSASFSPDSLRVVTASGDKTARVWRTDGKGEPLVLRGHEGTVSSASFSPDGLRVVTASDDKTARVWSTDGKGEPLVLRGHEGTVSSASFSPDGLRVVTASEDITARVWRADGKGEPLVLRGHEGPIWSASFSPDGLRVVTASWDKTARVWRADGKGEPLVLRGHESTLLSASFSPDGLRVVTASLDDTARVWRADGKGEPLVLRGHEDNVFSASFSPDGLRVVTASDDKTARVWRTDGKGEPLVLRGHEGTVRSASFSPDGLRVVTASWDKTARVWSTDGKGEPLVLRGHEGTVRSASFSPDGLRVVTASEDTTARVWRADGKGEPLVLRGHGGTLWSASFSPDGLRVVTASWDNTARVWRADGKGEPLVLRGHEDTVRSASFSPDGLRVVTASDDKTARVWSADGKGEPLVLRGHEGTLWSASFSPDGLRVVTASDDDTARMWPVTIPELQRLLRESNTDCLPPKIRRLYLDEPEAQAQERYEACERAHGRPPFFTATGAR